MSVVSIKYRIVPTKAQETALCQTLDLCREVYNSLVNERTAVYETQGRTLTMYDQIPHLRRWKEAHPELKNVHSQVLQNVAVRVDLAFKAFFRRVAAGEKPGYPRMKGKGWYDSITFPQAQKTGCRLTGEFLHVSKIGQIRCIPHRPLVGTPKTCTLRRQNGKWFACFSCEYEPEALRASAESVKRSRASVGIDVGLEKFAALSDGSFVENPRFFRRDEKALAKAQRKLTRQAQGTPSRKKARKVVSRIYERIRNRRHDFVHQFARRLVNRYGTIAVEKLNVTGMVGNHGARAHQHHLAKSISDAAWSMFRAVLTQKAESAGRVVVAVNPAYTSQDCSGCGFRAKKPLKERWHLCPMCGLSLDRDTNAAHNILKTALGQQSVVGIPA